MLMRFTWIPAPAGWKGNEAVDKSANEALQNNATHLLYPPSRSEVKTLIWKTSPESTKRLRH